MNEADVYEMMVEALLKENSNVFGNYFTNDGCESNVGPDVKAQADTIFKKVYSDNENFASFDEFLDKWKRSKIHNINTETVETLPASQICNKLSFDPSKREMVNVFGPRQKRTRSTEFDVFEFLKTRRDSGHPLRFQSDIDLEGDLEILMEPQNNAAIDIGLRKIARALTVLNQSCSYRLLDVYSERVVR